MFIKINGCFYGRVFTKLMRFKIQPLIFGKQALASMHFLTNNINNIFMKENTRHHSSEKEVNTLQVFFLQKFMSGIYNMFLTSV